MKMLGAFLLFVATLLALVLLIAWLFGGFMQRSCDETEQREVRLYNGPTIVAKVCIGEWQ